MKSELSQSRLHSYFDSELSTPVAAEFKGHLSGCHDCGAELVELDLLRDRLQLAQRYEPAPVSLQRKIRANLRLAERTTGV